MPDVVHVGYPKAGSTYLQKHVFPLINDCAFLTHWGPGAVEFRPLIRTLYLADDDHYLGRTISSFIDEWRASHPGPLLLSDENLTGGLLPIVDTWERNAERIHKLLPNAQILIVVRHQRSLLRSAYSHYVQRGGYATFDDVIAGRGGRATFQPEVFCFHHLVGRYQDLFGAERVKVVPYELIMRDEARFCSEIASLVHGRPTSVPAARGARENTSLSPPSIWIMRQTNRMFRVSTYNARPTVRKIGAASRLRPVLHRTVDRLVSSSLARKLNERTAPSLPDVLGTFEESNSILEEMAGVRLRELGYPMSEPGS